MFRLHQVSRRWRLVFLESLAFSCLFSGSATWMTAGKACLDKLDSAYMMGLRYATGAFLRSDGQNESNDAVLVMANRICSGSVLRLRRLNLLGRCRRWGPVQLRVLLDAHTGMKHSWIDTVSDDFDWMCRMLGPKAPPWGWQDLPDVLRSGGAGWPALLHRTKEAA